MILTHSVLCRETLQKLNGLPPKSKSLTMHVPYYSKCVVIHTARAYETNCHIDIWLVESIFCDLMKLTWFFFSLERDKHASCRMKSPPSKESCCACQPDSSCRSLFLPASRNTGTDHNTVGVHVRFLLLFNILSLVCRIS